MKKNRLQRSDVVWGFAVAALVILQFWWLPGDKGTTTDSYSTTIDGKLGIFRTLTQLFPDVHRDAAKLRPKDSATLLLIAPDRYPNRNEQQELYEFVYQGGTLLFAPNWSSEDVSFPSLGIRLDKIPGFWGAQTGTAIPVPGGAAPNASPSSSDSALPPAATPDSAATPDPSALPGTAQAEMPEEGSSASSGPLTTPGSAPAANPVTATSVPDEGQAAELTTSSPLVNGPITWRTRSTLRPPQHLSYESLVSAPGSEDTIEAATWAMGSGRVTVCSSPDVFSNRSMLFPDTRRLAVRLVENLHAHHKDEHGQDVPIVINEFLNASDSYRQTGVLFSPALRIGTLQLMLLAVLVLWFGFHRFGPAIATETIQRRSLTDSAKAVGNLQYRLQDGGAVVKNYLEYIRSQLRRRYGPGVQLEQTEAIAIRAGMRPDEVRIQLEEAHRVAAAPAVSSSRAAASLRWLAELQSRLARTQKS